MRSAVSYVHPRDEILQAIQRIYRYRMTTTSGGNLSIRDDNGDVWITPAGIDKGTLRREDIVCVHPGGARHSGVVEVRESWRQIFSQGPRLRFRLAGNRVFAGRILSVHSVYEHVAVAGDPRPTNPVLTTNIYLLTDRGWRMLVHHASPLAPEAAPRETPPSVLH